MEHQGNPITVILSTQQDPFVEGAGMGRTGRQSGRVFFTLSEHEGMGNKQRSNKQPAYYVLLHMLWIF